MIRQTRQMPPKEGCCCVICRMRRPGGTSAVVFADCQSPGKYCPHLALRVLLSLRERTEVRASHVQLTIDQHYRPRLAIRFGIER